MIANKYKIIEKISQGTFGQVFKAENIRTHEQVAIKVESKLVTVSSLKNEAKIYQYLSKVSGFPKLKMFGTTNNINYLIMNLLGQPILFHIKYLQNDILNIGSQMIVRIKSLHEMMLLHRDIKPNNFLFGIDNKTNKIYLIDLGFSKKYIHNGAHIPEKKITKIIGSPNFVSLNVHNLIEPSRRDDLESCIYVILTMIFGGHLEWFNTINLDELYKLKKNIIHNGQVPEFIKTMLNYVRSLNFEEIPNYEYLISCLNVNLD